MEEQVTGTRIQCLDGQALHAELGKLLLQLVAATGAEDALAEAQGANLEGERGRAGALAMTAATGLLGLVDFQSNIADNGNKISEYTEKTLARAAEVFERFWSRPDLEGRIYTLPPDADVTRREWPLPPVLDQPTSDPTLAEEDLTAIATACQDVMGALKAHRGPGPLPGATVEAVKSALRKQPGALLFTVDDMNIFFAEDEDEDIQEPSSPELETVFHLMAAGPAADPVLLDWALQLVGGHNALARSSVFGPEGHAPVHSAAAEGNLDAVKVMFQHSHSVTTARDRFGNSPLHLAAKHGHNADVLLLTMFCSADIMARNSEGETPLDVASTGSARTILKDFGKHWRGPKEKGPAYRDAGMSVLATLQQNDMAFTGPGQKPEFANIQRLLGLNDREFLQYLKMCGDDMGWGG